MSANTVLYENRAWVIDPANPSDVVVSGTAGSVGGGGQRLTNKTRDGSVRKYGNGRVRALVGSSTVIILDLALIRLTPTDEAQLDAWRDAGTVLLFRDIYGQKAFGTILATSHYFEPNTVATNALAVAGYGTYVSNGPFIDIAISINQVTVPVGS